MVKTKTNDFIQMIISCYCIDKKSAIKEFGLKTCIFAHSNYINLRLKFYDEKIYNDSYIGPESAA